ncbi:MAG: DNA polymerase Y family protein [Alphaproteobacteria bacterium]|nr:MAG: DNA polymerase Y family protein [Alphaproteobacteria bacterium]
MWRWRMRRVMYVFLPSWPIDRLRRLTEKRGGSLPSLCNAVPADEPPFATVTASGGRRLIAALNPAAAKAGLAPGMPLPDALSFVPGLVTAPADPAADRAALTRLAEWCGRYSPWTAPDETDGVKIEITGSAHLWGGESALVADLSRRLLRQQIAHRIAVASTLGTAWALARHAADAGQPALPTPQDERAALAPLPVEALRLDPDTVQGLRRVGLRHIGELYPMPRDALARRFGANGLENSVAYRLDQAFGDLPEPLSPLGETPSRRVRLSFAEPIADPADLARAIERLVEDLAARLAREGMGARRLALGFHRVDGRVEHIRLGTARPTRDPRHLAKLFAAKLDTVDPGLGVEDMILAVFAAEKLEPEQTEFSPHPPAAGVTILPPPLAGEGRGGGIASLLDRLGNRLGLDAISHIEPRASHIPERASIYVRIEEKRGSASNVIPGSPAGRGPESMNTGLWKMDSGLASSARPGMTSGEPTGNSRKPPRPVRLFRPPEPIEAQWVLPDDPPFRFTWRRRQHRVRHADGPERIAEEWWIEDSAADPRASGDRIRDYYRVEDEEGRRFWLYRAGLPGDPPPRWFVHGIFA